MASWQTPVQEVQCSQPVPRVRSRSNSAQSSGFFVLTMWAKLWLVMQVKCGGPAQGEEGQVFSLQLLDYGEPRDSRWVHSRACSVAHTVDVVVWWEVPSDFFLSFCWCRLWCKWVCLLFYILTFYRICGGSHDRNLGLHNAMLKCNHLRFDRLWTQLQWLSLTPKLFESRCQSGCFWKHLASMWKWTCALQTAAVSSISVWVNEQVNE